MPLTPAEIASAASRCNLTAAVFGKPGIGGSLLDVATVFLEEDNGSRAAEVAARGYEFCGTIAVVNGEVKTTYERVSFAAAAIVSAGVLFAERLGALLRQLQKEQLKPRA